MLMMADSKVYLEGPVVPIARLSTGRLNMLAKIICTPDNSSRREYLPAIMAFVLACAGCYDGQQLIEQVRDEAIRMQLEEIDLGTYRTTMPRDTATATFTDMQFRIFGNVPRYRMEAIQRQLEEDTYRLRHETLAAVREATHDELTDPDLTKLRQRLANVVNGLLADSPIDSIGFADVRFLHH